MAEDAGLWEASGLRGSYVSEKDGKTVSLRELMG
jgi:hypothetical protein